MFEFVKAWLYHCITWSGIIIHVYPLLNFLRRKFGIAFKPVGNYQVTDDGGAIFNFTKYNGRVFPPFNVESLAGISGLTIRKDDVLLCGYPKTGCHWVYEIMNMLVTQKVALTKNGKEFGGMIDAMPSIILDSLPSPRVLNSHLLYEELPEQIKARKTKIVWTVRAPKDTVVSFYNHVSLLENFYRYKGSFENYFKLYMAGKLDYGSYFDFILSWEKAMKAQSDNSILVVEYEKLKKDPLPVVKGIAKFLGVSISDKFAEDILEESKFNRMKEKRSGTIVGGLFRKGQVGDWRNWLNEAQSSQVDELWKMKMSGCFYQPEL